MNIYVANLDYQITDQDLRQLFSEYGEVSTIKVITDYNTGQSRGFAFVEMPNDEEAQKAISNINGRELNNRAISAQVAKPKEERPRRVSYPERDGYKRY